MNIHTQIVVVVFVLSVWLSLLWLKCTGYIKCLSGCLVLQGTLKQVTGVAYHFTSCLIQGWAPKIWKIWRCLMLRFQFCNILDLEFSGSGCTTRLWLYLAYHAQGRPWVPFPGPHTVNRKAEITFLSLKRFRPSLRYCRRVTYPWVQPGRSHPCWPLFGAATISESGEAGRLWFELTCFPCQLAMGILLLCLPVTFSQMSLVQVVSSCLSILCKSSSLSPPGFEYFSQPTYCLYLKKKKCKGYF